MTVNIGEMPKLTCSYCTYREVCMESDREMTCSDFAKKHDYHDLTAMLNGEDKRIRKAAKRQIKRMTERGVT